jgi:hypothetical protein
MAQTAPPLSAAPLAPPRNLAAALLLAALLAALVAIWSGLVARAVPAWRPAYLPAACLLVAVEAALVRYRMLRGRHLEAGALPYLAAELFALAVLMRAVATLSLGAAGLPGGLERYVRSPLAAVDGPFVGCLAAGLAVALLVRAGLGLLARLDPRPPAQETGLAAEVFRAAEERDEREALGRLAAGLGWGGALALVGLVGQVVDVGRLAAPPLPLPAASALAGVAYLICAVLLYSWGRLGLLRSRWARDEAAVEPAVAGRWRGASVALVLAVAVAGLALPGGYGGELLAAAQGGLVAVVNLFSLVALFLGALAVGAFGLVLTIPALILAMLPRAAPDPGAAAPPPPPPPPPPPAPAAPPPFAPGLIFWACVAILVGYALWAVLRRQEWAVAAARRLRDGWLGRALAWLRGAWASTAGYARAVGEALAERLRPPPASPRPARPRLGRMGPGELVRYFYRAALSRAERGGLGRAPAETPYEYGARLRADLPEDAEAVDGLTEEYVAAAYGPRPATPADARRARALWERLRAALRSLRDR